MVYRCLYWSFLPIIPAVFTWIYLHQIGEVIFLKKSLLYSILFFIYLSAYYAEVAGLYYCLSNTDSGFQVSYLFYYFNFYKLCFILFYIHPTFKINSQFTCSSWFGFGNGDWWVWDGEMSPNLSWTTPTHFLTHTPNLILCILQSGFAN